MAGVGAAAGVEDAAVESVGRVDLGLRARAPKGSEWPPRERERSGTHIRHVRPEMESFGVPQLACDLATGRREPLEVDGQDERGVLDRKVLLGVDELLAPAHRSSHQHASTQKPARVQQHVRPVRTSRTCICSARSTCQS